MTISIAGYCWPLSAAPGAKLSFMIYGQGPSTAIFERQRSVSDALDPILMGEISFVAKQQPLHDNHPWKTGCGWAETFPLVIPHEWQSGLYSATCSDSTGSSCSISFVVRPAPSRRARTAVLANVNTWLAYNAWGGKGKYDNQGTAAQVSFLRPNPVAAPDGLKHLTRGELWVLGWLEREGFQYDLMTDIDFHNEGLDPVQYPRLVLNTHPEYWTLTMYDNLRSYLGSGGTLIYLGGNGIFENGEYVAGQTGMMFRQGVEGGPREPAMFRLLKPPRHERAILGVSTERSGALPAAYLVEDGREGHPLLAFTGLTRSHRRFGDQGFNIWDDGVHEGKASGWEVDTADGPGSVGLPEDSDLDPSAFPVPPSALPSGLVVLARGERDDNGKRGADMTLYNHPGGGFVFSAGSITFGGSLVTDEALRHILLNVFARAGLQPSSTWIADFTGGGKADVLFYYPGDDNWWLGSMATGQLAWTKVGNTGAFGHNITDGRPFWIADFTGDGKADVLFYYPGDDNWWLGNTEGNALGWTLTGKSAGFSSL
jgi:hypothetical protein